MSAISRRTMITRGLAAAAGLSGLAIAERVADRYGLVPPDHGGIYGHPGGGWFGEVGVAWLDWQLKGSTDAARYFTGDHCLLCDNPIWEVERKQF